MTISKTKVAELYFQAQHKVTFLPNFCDPDEFVIFFQVQKFGITFRTAYHKCTEDRTAQVFTKIVQNW